MKNILPKDNDGGGQRRTERRSRMAAAGGLAGDRDKGIEREEDIRRRKNK
jgi:hypothetical protein